MSCASSTRALREIVEGEPLRFGVGDRVICKIGRNWQAGKIVQDWWQHPANLIYHPYQVQLQTDQRLVYVPIDDDDIIRKIEHAWWEALRDQEDLADDEVAEVIEKLSKGRNLDVQSHDGETALLCALKRGWNAAARALLRLKADPNCPGQNCERPINVAVLHLKGATRADLTKVLLQAKSDPQLQDKDPDKDPDYDSRSFQEREWHRTALHYAAELGCTETVRMLLEASAEPDVQDAQYKMPLHLAIERRQLDAIRLLIESRSDISTGNMEIGLTTSPIIDAAYRDDQALMHLLINSKADLDHRGKQDMTALHVAARGRNVEVVRILLEAGANTTLLAGGRTAGELAFKNGLTETAALFGYLGGSDDKLCRTASQVPDAKTRTLLFMDEPVAKHLRSS